MILVVNGAYRNCGDHLIRDRALKLLRTVLGDEIAPADRKAVTAEALATAQGVILSGGPAYQRRVYPDVYPFEISAVKGAVSAFGIGYKDDVGAAPAAFRFEPPALAFVQELHARTPESSVRGYLTLEALKANGVTNVRMTGCPVWYDLERFETVYSFPTTIGHVAFSGPARPRKETYAALDAVARAFPTARRTLALHHGAGPRGWRWGKELRRNLSLAAYALARGWRIADLSGGHEAMTALYDVADLHVGYRVHAHLLRLSMRKASLLFAEDARAAEQCDALGAPTVTRGEEQGALAAYLESRGAENEAAVERMRATWPEMRAHLEILRDHMRSQAGARP